MSRTLSGGRSVAKGREVYWPRAVIRSALRDVWRTATGFTASRRVCVDAPGRLVAPLAFQVVSDGARYQEGGLPRCPVRRAP